MTRLFGTLALAALLVGTLAPAASAQGRGRIACEITDNGESASGTVIVRDGSREVASGSCSSPLAVPPGSYQVTIQLDGCLDRPTQREQVQVAPGATAQVRAAFRTGTLEVSITAGGRRAAAMATLFKNGQRVGSLASGVPAHVSVGTYDVVVRYRGEERRFAGVNVTAGQRRALNVEL